MKLSDLIKGAKKPIPWVLVLVAAALMAAALIPQSRQGEHSPPGSEPTKLALQQPKGAGGPTSVAAQTRSPLKDLPAPRPANKDGAKEPDDWMRFRVETKVTDIAILIVVGLAVMVLTLQARYVVMSMGLTKRTAEAAEASATVARESLQAIERAYIRLDNFVLQGFGPGETPVITYVATNDGRTPGDILSLSVNYTIAAELPAKPVYDAEGPGTLTIPPGRSFPTFRFFQQPLAPDQFANVMNGTWACFLWVCLIYKDAFGILHTDGFAMKYVPFEPHRRIDGDGWERTQQGSFRIYNADGYNYSGRTASQPAPSSTVS